MIQVRLEKAYRRAIVSWPLSGTSSFVLDQYTSNENRCWLGDNALSAFEGVSMIFPGGLGDNAEDRLTCGGFSALSLSPLTHHASDANADLMLNWLSDRRAGRVVGKSLAFTCCVPLPFALVVASNAVYAIITRFHMSYPQACSTREGK